MAAGEADALLRVPINVEVVPMALSMSLQPIIHFREHKGAVFLYNPVFTFKQNQTSELFIDLNKAPLFNSSSSLVTSEY